MSLPWCAERARAAVMAMQVSFEGEAIGRPPAFRFQNALQNEHGYERGK